MINHRALSLLYRVITIRPLDRLTLWLLRDATKRFGNLLPREMFEGIDQLFFRDAIGNVDRDGDGVADSFRLTVNNAWFDQRITGILFYVDGRRVPQKKLIFRSPCGEIRASSVTGLEFLPGEAMEIIAEGLTLDDGLHFIDMTLEMELVSMLMPGLPILMKEGAGDFAILPDCLNPLPDWPPSSLEPGAVHVVPHIHYDVEWLKTRETFQKVGEANLLEALRIMEKDPRMTFVLDQVPHLEPFRLNNPEAFNRFVSLVEEGRVEPVNGMYSEPDTNLIGGESLIRQSVAWQRYSMERFGRISRCGWLIDSFGMSAQLPQIMSLSGVEFFAYSRAKVPDRYPSEFLWEGIDGTRLLTHNMQKMYNVGHPVPTDRSRALRKMLKNYLALRPRSSSGEVFYPGGVDHGRPQEAYGEMIRAWNSEVKGVSFNFSLPSRFFESIDRENLPVVRGEFQRELWGTYSARIELKKLNRACEFALLDAGKLALIASLSGGEYPANELDQDWRKVMDNQFHDQICGCCTDQVSSGMAKRYEEVLENARDLMSKAAGFLSEDISRGEEFTLLAFNPIARPVSSWVEFEVLLPPGWSGVSVSSGGERIPVQIVDATRYSDGGLKRVRAGICPDLPPLGYRLFKIEPSGDEAPRTANPVSVKGMALENEFFRLELDGSTGLLRRVVLTDGTEFDLAGGNRLTLERDFGNLYEVMALGITFLRRRRVSSVRAVEEGPLRATVEVSGIIGRSPFTQRISIVAGSPRIDLETSIYFRNKGCRLRCRFPTGIQGGRWVHEIPYGVIERPGHELPAQNFTDISGRKSGVTLINRGIPGNKCEKGTIYLTLLRSTDKIFLWDSGPGGLELGQHLFKYALYPHRGNHVEAGSALEAYRHNNPPRAFVFPGFGPEASGSFSAVSSGSPNVLVSVLERNANGDVVLRAWETSGEARVAEFEFGWDVREAIWTDLLEREFERRPVEGNRLSIPLGPFEIVTLILKSA